MFYSFSFHKKLLQPMKVDFHQCTRNVMLCFYAWEKNCSFHNFLRPQVTNILLFSILKHLKSNKHCIMNHKQFQRTPKKDNLYNLKSMKSYPLLVDWRTSKLPWGPESETVSDMLKLNERVDSPPSLFSSRQAPGFGNEGILIVWNKKEFTFTNKRIV